MSLYNRVFMESDDESLTPRQRRVKYGNESLVDPKTGSAFRKTYPKGAMISKGLIGLRSSIHKNQWQNRKQPRRIDTGRLRQIIDRVRRHNPDQQKEAQ